MTKEQIERGDEILHRITKLTIDHELLCDSNKLWVADEEECKLDFGDKDLHVQMIDHGMNVIEAELIALDKELEEL